MPVNQSKPATVFSEPDSPGHHAGNPNPFGLPDYRCPAHAKLTTYFVERDRYDNYWVCGLYRDGDERRFESYVVTQGELKNIRYPNLLVVSAIREIDNRLARYINQPLYF